MWPHHHTDNPETQHSFPVATIIEMAANMGGFQELLINAGNTDFHPGKPTSPWKER